MAVTAMHEPAQSQRAGAEPAVAPFRLDRAVQQFEAPLLRYTQQLLWPHHDDAQDVVQDTFMRLHKHVQLYGISAINSLNNWLYRVAHNLAMDRIRRRSRRQNLNQKILSDPVLTPEQQQQLDLGGTFAHKEACALALAHLQELPAEQKQVVMLKIIEQMTLQQISDITGLKIGTVNYRLLQGLSELAKRLKAAGAI